ncbi:hypothetical protein A0H81_10056 [Grifola frondosa]|uniref:Uncharacterized protein n=1 Tax=Grifola frondosa TaxID=5627 RepID=A0A1C7LZT3_GRIFR|nr:hypothetical protein A0H81_10056 [Grifola frondosa]
MAIIAERAGSVHVRVGGNTQETATLAQSLADGAIIEKDKTDTTNPDNQATCGNSLQWNHSWDSTLQSTTIRNLATLNLVGTRISHLVLARVAHAYSLQNFTLCGTL